MAEFLPAFAKTNGNEGGVSFNPGDLGNVVVKGIVVIPTYKGIAPVSHPKWSGWKYISGVIAVLTPMPAYGTDAHVNWARHLNRKLAELPALQNLVIEFYRRNFWDANRLGEITSQPVAEWAYDHVVNAGGRGAMWIQLAARVTPDGDIGTKSIAAINAADPEALLNRAEDIAGAFRLDRAHNKSSQIQFLTSWLRRDGQPEEIIAMVRKAAADGVLDATEVATLKTAMAATA
ncbi:MAG: glycosyl hydrolase 108 family protein [Desulfuromonadaceae bacterium]